jgi:hypothetical protein
MACAPGCDNFGGRARSPVGLEGQTFRAELLEGFFDLIEVTAADPGRRQAKLMFCSKTREAAEVTADGQRSILPAQRDTLDQD